MNIFLLVVCLSWSFILSAASWYGSNDPYTLGAHFKNRIADLPENGKLEDQRLGWPGSHWASYVGSIAHRWSAGTPENFSYKYLSLEELKKLEPHQLAELSPAEKFDIYNGNYNYPITKSVLRMFSPDESEWHGICHGYAPAALNHPEPATVELVNPDGLNVHFYSSDVAGLMSFYYAKVVSTPSVLIGNRCNYSANERIPRKHQAACEDFNAGAFHIVLTNKLGIDGVGFIADIDRYAEVWNHVAVSYQTRYLGESMPVKTSAYGTVKRVLVESLVTFAAAIAPKFDPVMGTESAVYIQNPYEYYLDIDKRGKIIGGDWVSTARPDFVWTQKKASFTGVWSPLMDIYRPSDSL